MATNQIGRRSVLGRSWSCCSWRFSGKSAAAADGKDEFFRHRLWIIAALAFAGWHWLQPHSRAHGYTPPAIEQGQAIEGRCVGVTDGNTIKVLSAGNELIRVRLAFIDTPEKAPAFGQRAKRGIHE